MADQKDIGRATSGAAAAPTEWGRCASELIKRAAADFAVHLPADPEQQDTAGQGQTDDGEQLRRDGREKDTQADRAGKAPEDDPPTNFGRYAGRGKPDDDRVIASQHDVDDNDLHQRNELRVKVFHALSIQFSRVGWLRTGRSLRC